MGPDEMDQVADMMVDVFSGTESAEGSKAKYTVTDGLSEKVKARAAELLGEYPLYPTVDLG
jgi:glycine hydroxymethyltransferase